MSTISSLSKQTHVGCAMTTDDRLSAHMVGSLVDTNLDKSFCIGIKPPVRLACRVADRSLVESRLSGWACWRPPGTVQAPHCTMQTTGQIYVDSYTKSTTANLSRYPCSSTQNTSNDERVHCFEAICGTARTISPGLSTTLLRIT